MAGTSLSSLLLFPFPSPSSSLPSYFPHSSNQMSVSYRFFFILIVCLSRQTIDSFQINHVGAPLQRINPSMKTSTVTSALSSASFSELQKSQQLGHPDLLQAIANFPSKLLAENTRKDVLDDDAQRIFHGRGGLYEGANHLTLDYYPPVFLLTSFEELQEDELNVYDGALFNMWELLMASSNGSIDEATNDKTQLTWVYQCRAEIGNSTTRLMKGSIPEPHVVTEFNGRNKFYVHLLKGQNHGLFLDMAAGRQWLQDTCAKADVNSVLNLFAYTCAFSVAALNGGAQTVVNVDMSRGALKTGQRNHDLTELGSDGKRTAKFLSHDIFKSWGKIKRLGPYDVIVIDPPSYQKGSFVATKDYIKVIRRLPSLLRPDGYALLCLNAPELTTEFLLEQVSEGISNDELKFVKRLDNPPEFASAFPEKALKVMLFQYKPINNVQEEVGR